MKGELRLPFFCAARKVDGAGMMTYLGVAFLGFVGVLLFRARGVFGVLLSEPKMRVGDYDGALRRLRWMSLGIPNVTALHKEGLILSLAGRPAEAEPCYRKALAMLRSDSRYPRERLLASLGYALLDLRRYAEAEQCFHAAIEAGDVTGNSQDGLAEMRLVRGVEAGQALDYARQAIEHAKRRPDGSVPGAYYAHQAWALALEGRSQEAREPLAEALRAPETRAPNNAGMHWRAGMVLLAMQRSDEARRLPNRARRRPARKVRPPLRRPDPRDAVGRPGSLLALDRPPGLVRIEACHLPRQRGRGGAEILLVNDALVAHQERLDARHAVLRRVGDQRESADHLAVHHVVHGAARGVGALGFQHAEEVAVIRRRLSGVGGHGGRGIGERLGHGAAGLALPIQAVLLARGSRHLLGILQHAVAIAVLRGVLHLGFHVPAAHVDGSEFVAAHAARQNLDASRGRIEPPLAVLADQGNRERPILGSDDHGRAVGIAGLGRDHHLGVRQSGEVRAAGFVLGGIAGFHDVASGGSEDLQQGGGVVLRGGIDQRLGGFLRGCEAAPGGLRGGVEQRQPRGNYGGEI